MFSPYWVLQEELVASYRQLRIDTFASAVGCHQDQAEFFHLLIRVLRIFFHVLQV
jgi:hypothetical protein